MLPRAETIVNTLLKLNALADLPRTGWLLRGVRPCESIADHSFGVALTVMLLVDGLRAEGTAVDGERALRLALIHDAPEACTGDLPAPHKSAQLTAALHRLEVELVEGLLPAPERELWSSLEGDSLEARVVRAADKIQMMTKALVYGRHHPGAVEDFWANPKNFDDCGVPLARTVFDVLLERSGRSSGPLPRT